MPVKTEKEFTVEDISKTLRYWEERINERVVERTREVRGFILAATAGVHMLQLGPPGTSKTYMVVTGLDLIEGAKVMKAQLHGFSMMEDLYGPLSLKLLDQDRYVRKTDMYLPWADFFMGDEIFKANPTILQANLWLLNERKFRNDGQILDVPLISAYFMSNEGPQDETLAAFDDRIHLRYEVGPIREPSNRMVMLQMRLLKDAEAPRPPAITLDQIKAANEMVRKVEVPVKVLNALNDLHSELAAVQVRPTDRKFNDTLDVIRATAVYNGRMTAMIEDMKYLDAMLWNDPRDRVKVTDKIQDLGNPLEKDAQKLANAIEVLAKDVEEVIAIEGETLRIRRGVQLNAKIQEASGELVNLRRKAKSEGLESDVLDEARRRLKSSAERLLEKGLGESVDEK